MKKKQKNKQILELFNMLRKQIVSVLIDIFPHTHPINYFQLKFDGLLSLDLPATEPAEQPVPTLTAIATELSLCYCVSNLQQLRQMQLDNDGDDGGLASVLSL